MGVGGYLAYFSEDGNVDIHASALGVLNLAKPERGLFVWRDPAERRDWEAWRTARSRGQVFAPAPTPCLLEQGSIADSVSMIEEEACTTIKTYGSDSLSRQVVEAITEGVPAEVRGSFLPSELIIRAGWHDLYETSSNPNGFYIARARISISFYGDGVPLRPSEIFYSIVDCQGLRRIQSDLEGVVGSLHHFVYWP